MATATDTQTKEKVSKAGPFSVQIDHPRNNDILLQSIPGARLRSTIRADRLVKDAKTGEERMPVDSARHLGMFPSVPGMIIKVNPAKLTYWIIDPLHGDEEKCAKIKRAMNESSPYRTGDKIDGIPEQVGKLDKHRMKTLCRELLYLIEAGHAKIVGDGSEPTHEKVAALDGEFLLNPGSRVRNTQPRYEKDFEPWVDQLTQAGG